MIIFKIPGQLWFLIRPPCVISVTHLLHVASAAWCVQDTLWAFSLAQPLGEQLGQSFLLIISFTEAPMLAPDEQMMNEGTAFCENPFQINCSQTLESISVLLCFSCDSVTMGQICVTNAVPWKRSLADRLCSLIECRAWYFRTHIWWLDYRRICKHCFYRDRGSLLNLLCTS